jgi:predicted DNA-binding WGR domain protein
MLTYQWLNRAKDRFYQITVKQNGLTNIVLDYHWGSCNSNRGGVKSISLCSKEEAKKTIEQMMKRRKSRGYELVAPIIN